MPKPSHGRGVPCVSIRGIRFRILPGQNCTVLSNQILTLTFKPLRKKFYIYIYLYHVLMRSLHVRIVFQSLNNPLFEGLLYWKINLSHFFLNLLRISASFLILASLTKKLKLHFTFYFWVSKVVVFGVCLFCIKVLLKASTPLLSQSEIRRN